MNIEWKSARCLKMTVLAVVILGAGAFATNVRAQDAGTFEVQVPFDFVVKNRTYEAGSYRIGRLNHTNLDTLVLRTATGKTLAILQTQRGSSNAPVKLSKLIFSRYGETYFLDGIHASSESYESRLPSVKSERQRRGAAQFA